MWELFLEWIFCLFKKFLQERVEAQKFHEKNFEASLGGANQLRLNFHSAKLILLCMANRLPQASHIDCSYLFKPCFKQFTVPNCGFVSFFTAFLKYMIAFRERVRGLGGYLPVCRLIKDDTLIFGWMECLSDLPS
jgi:hypothetical protein